MEQRTRTIELPESKQSVTIKAELSYWDLECIQAAIADGANVTAGGDNVAVTGSAWLASKMTLFQRAIISIKNEAGEDVKFTQEWIESLRQEDGNILHGAAQSLKKK